MTKSLLNIAPSSLGWFSSTSAVLWVMGTVATVYAGVMAFSGTAIAADVSRNMSGWAGSVLPVDPMTGRPLMWLVPDRFEQGVRNAQRAADQQATRAVEAQLAAGRSRAATQLATPTRVSASPQGSKSVPVARSSEAQQSIAQSSVSSPAPVALASKSRSAQPVNPQLAKAFYPKVRGVTGVEYSKLGGLVLDVGVQLTPDNKKSLVLLGKVGEDQKQALATVGIELGERRELIIQGSYLTQENLDDLTSRTFTADQWSTAVSLRIGTSNKLYKVIEPKISASRSSDSDIGSWDDRVISWTNTLTYGNDRKFIGDARVGGGVGVTMDVGRIGELTLTPQITHRAFNDGSDSGPHLGGSAEYGLYLSEWWKASLSASYVVDRTKFNASYVVAIPGTTIQVEPTAFYSTGGDMPVNYGGGIQLSIPLWGGVSDRSFDRPLPWASMNIGPDTWQSAKKFASETQEINGKRVTVRVLKSTVSNAPGLLGALTITNDGGWSTTDGEMNTDPNTTFNAATNTARYEVQIDGGAWVNIGNTTSFRPGVTAGISALADGTHTIQVRAVSAVGLTSTPSSITVTIDTVVPTATGYSFPNLDTAGGGFTGTISWSESVRSQSVTVSNGGTGSVTSGDDTATHTITGTAGTDPGWVRESVMDEAGNTVTGQSPDHTLF